MSLETRLSHTPAFGALRNLASHTHRLARSIREVLHQSFKSNHSHLADYDWFSESEVAGYDRAQGPEDFQRVDDATWRDLEMSSYLRQIGIHTSIFGRQYLYTRLRRGDAARDQSESPLRQADEPQSSRLLSETRDVRLALRSQKTEVTDVLYRGALPSVPSFARSLWLAPVALLIGLAAAIRFESLTLATFSAIAYFVAFGVAQIRLHSTLSTFKGQRIAIMGMLAAAAEFGEIGRRRPHTILERGARSLADTRRLISSLSLNFIERLPQLIDYVNLLTLYECIVLGSKVARMRGHLDELQKVYDTVAECEATLSLLEHLAQRPNVCWARPSEPHSLQLTDMYNPLLELAEPLTLSLDKRGAFITGQNGVGKSTFLRALGLNILVARAFGFCYAKDADLPRVPVWSSIQNEDSLDRAESLYMAELRRAETLLRVSRSDSRAIFIIDEIFRGTNNLESVSAATGVINRLATNAIVVVSSHNLVLAPLLRAKLDSLRIVREESLRLESGVLAETNGIRLMDDYEIEPSIRSDAKRVFDWFSGYVMQPTNFPELD